MTDPKRPGDGDSELAAPVEETSHPGARATDLDNEDTAGRTAARSRPSNLVMLIGGILVIVVAQLVTSFLVLSSTNQLRDQYTAANGLQRCLIRAQLSASTASDPSGTAYKAAVNTCLK